MNQKLEKPGLFQRGQSRRGITTEEVKIVEEVIRQLAPPGQPFVFKQLRLLIELEKRGHTPDKVRLQGVLQRMQSEGLLKGNGTSRGWTLLKPLEKIHAFTPSQLDFEGERIVSGRQFLGLTMIDESAEKGHILAVYREEKTGRLEVHKATPDDLIASNNTLKA